MHVNCLCSIKMHDGMQFSDKNMQFSSSYVLHTERYGYGYENTYSEHVREEGWKVLISLLEKLLVSGCFCLF